MDAIISVPRRSAQHTASNKNLSNVFYLVIIFGAANVQCGALPVVRNVHVRASFQQCLDLLQVTVANRINQVVFVLSLRPKLVNLQGVRSTPARGESRARGSA